MFNELKRTQRGSLIPDAQKRRHIWSDIWDLAVIHRANTDWLRKVENEIKELTVQDDSTYLKVLSATFLLVCFYV